VIAGVPVGLGVDGAASNESGVLQLELKQAVLMSRARYGPTAMACRDALALATMHGARCLGRATEIGSLEVGKRADIALWRLDDLGAAGIEDPVAALVLGPPRRCDELLVAGRVVVADGALATGSETALAADAARASRRLAERAA